MQRTSDKANGQWVSLGVASHLLGVNESTLRQWADRGLVRTFRTPGGHRRFSRADMAHLVESRTSEDQADTMARWRTTALRKIRRRLQRTKPEANPWQTKMDEASKERLRLFGRRLLQLTADYSSQRGPRPELLAEARLIGEGQGREMARLGVPLEEAVQAYVFFRNSFMDTVGETWQSQGVPPWEMPRLWRQGSALLDSVLLAVIAAYQETAKTLGEGTVGEGR